MDGKLIKIQSLTTILLI